MGGSGKYTWLMGATNNVGSVNESGWFTPRALGVTTIIAQDVAKSQHFGQAQITVETPAKLEFMAGLREVSDNHTLTVAVQVFNANSMPYQYCQHLKLSWQLQHPKGKALLESETLSFRILDKVMAAE